MDLDNSITDGRTAIDDIRDVSGTLDGVVLKDLVSSLTGSANELEGYLLSDAEEARSKISELEEEIDQLKEEIRHGNQD